MNQELLHAFLPTILVAHFELVDFKKQGNTETNTLSYEMYLDEKNELPTGVVASEYESKGFLPASRVQDFPIRGKAVYLIIRRRRWRHKQSKQEIKNDYSLVSKGAKLTQELSDFLKGTGRDPSRYGK